MTLLPLDLILTVGSAAVIFLLGLTVWSRNKWSTGSVLYGLAALSLALWTSSDWFLRLEGTALPFQVLYWKLLFNVSVCFGPALAMHIAAHVSRRTFHRNVPLVYGVCFIACLLLISGLLAKAFGSASFISGSFLGVGALIEFLIYVGALMFTASHLYPVIFSSSNTYLERRRASYGILLIIVFLFAGALQLVVGPLPMGFFLPALTIAFILLSLAAFIRASFLDVQLGTLEPFLLVLVTFGIILLLRADDLAEAIVALAGIIVIGTFGSMAVRTVGTERRKRLMLEAANRELKMLEEAKNDFVDMVAHQLRTPLGGIRASSAMLRDGDYGTLPDKAKQASVLIEDAATRLLSLADTFLSMSRVEVGNYRTRRSVADIRHELLSVIEEMDVSSKTKGVELVSTVDKGVPHLLRIDTEALRNALFNLIDNAIKYTEHGQVNIAIRSTNGSLVATVKDTGPGMAPDDVRELFKKFHRGTVGHAHAVDGTGLGLYVVRRLLEAAGGRISASSDGPGKGSTFTVTLPIEPA